MDRKKLKVQPDKVRLLTEIELIKLPHGYMDIPVINWQEEQLEDKVDSDEEDEPEFEPTGKWRTIPAWSSDAPGPDESPLGAVATASGGAVGEEQEQSGAEGRHRWSITADWSTIHKDCEGLDETQRFTSLLQKSPSCVGKLEKFVGKSYQLNTNKEEDSDGGNEKSEERRIPIWRPWWDHEPLADIPVPRFIWQVESETDLFTNRQIRIVNFQDNSVFQLEFRALRRNYTEYIDVEMDEEEEEDINELLSLDVLETIRPVFNNGPLSITEYRQAIVGALGLSGDPNAFPTCLSELFTKVDTFAMDKISWDDLCDFLQQQFAEKAETDYSSPPVALSPPCTIFETPHHAPITRAFTLADKGLLCFSEDGVVSLWTSSFKPRIWRALGRPASLKTLTNISDKKSNKWMTDIVYIARLSKFLVPTGERELQFYDTATYDPYCQIVQLFSVPIHIDAQLTPQMQLIVVMGDISGCVTVLIVDQPISTLRNWSQQRRVNSVPTIPIHEAVGAHLGVKYAKFKVHDDMVSNIIFCTSMNRVVTASINQQHSLVMGTLLTTWNANEMMEHMTTNFVEGITDLLTKPKRRKPADEVIFPISNGCRTFDIWEEKRWLAAGGLDRLVWVWNMYVPHQPIAKLRGHNAALFKVIFDPRSETLFSICTEKTIRVWQLLTNTCIHVLDVKASKIKGPILHCFFPTTDGILIQTNDESQFLRISRSGDDTKEEGTTHVDGITAVCYNPQHEFIMSVSSEDILVWECETGKNHAEFNTIGGDGSMHLDTVAEKKDAPMEAENIFIMPQPLVHGREQVDTYEVGTVTCVTLDNKGRRFFTAHANGVIKAWNFYNGRNLYNLYKPVDNLDICDMHYITVNAEHRYLMTVGWDRRVVIYIDTQGPEVVHQLSLPDEPIEFTHETLGHRDDIWACTFGYPNLIASGDYSGRLMVWNINSGHIVGYLRPNAARDRNLASDKFVTSLIFHTQTVRNKKTTYLISSGPYHLMHFWRTNTTRELNIGSVGWTRPCDLPRDYVTVVKSVPENNLIVCADTWGCVSVWSLSDSLGDKEPTEWFSKRNLIRGKDETGFRPLGSYDVSAKKQTPDGRMSDVELETAVVKDGDSVQGLKTMIQAAENPIYNFDIDRVASRFGISFKTTDENTIEHVNVLTRGNGNSDGSEKSDREVTFKDVDTEYKGGKLKMVQTTQTISVTGDIDITLPSSVMDVSLKPSVSQMRRLKDGVREQERLAEFVGSETKENVPNAAKLKAQRAAASKKKKGFGLGPVQMKFIRSWKCHVDGFASLEVCNTYGLIVTGSKDRSVRVWDFEGNHLGILGQDTWLVGDPTSYRPMHPQDVILDVKRIRGFEFFRKAPPPLLDSEIEADKVVKKMLQQAERPRMTDVDIMEKSYPYAKLLSYSIPTTLWIQQDAPVGSYRRSIIDRTKEEIAYTEGTGVPRRKKKFNTSEVKRF